MTNLFNMRPYYHHHGGGDGDDDDDNDEDDNINPIQTFFIFHRRTNSHVT